MGHEADVGRYPRLMLGVWRRGMLPEKSSRCCEDGRGGRRMCSMESEMVDAAPRLLTSLDWGSL